MKIKKFYIVFFCSAFLFVTLTAYVSGNKSLTKVFGKSEIVKVVNEDGKIKFNHELHIKDAALTCNDCHSKAYTSEKATDNIFPVKEDCAKCHDVKDDKDCNKCHYYNKFEKLTASGKELVFSHRKHLAKNKDCLQCHSGIEKSKIKGDVPNGGYAPMTVCYTCHDGKKQVNNCEACHTNLTNLKPKDHLNSNYLNEHKLFTDAVTGNANNNCMMCHSDYFCEACHQPVRYTGENRPENFYTPYYTKDFATRTDRTSLQKLTTVHDLNYQYTHGLDANQKSYECKTCHDPVDFCASCHRNGGNLQTGLMPKSHLQPNFKTFGVNTGGGLHAELARRDMESCEACHSVNGADPTCIQCHVDNDGVKGTNPKTHETGFENDNKGNWHSIKGAICYTCHTDANARPDGEPGRGFCGYCHGNNETRKLK
jgi:hypothetical protein